VCIGNLEVAVGIGFCVGDGGFGSSCSRGCPQIAARSGSCHVEGEGSEPVNVCCIKPSNDAKSGEGRRANIRR